MENAKREGKQKPNDFFYFTLVAIAVVTCLIIGYYVEVFIDSIQFDLSFCTEKMRWITFPFKKIAVCSQ